MSYNDGQADRTTQLLIAVQGIKFATSNKHYQLHLQKSSSFSPVCVVEECSKLLLDERRSVLAYNFPAFEILLLSTWLTMLPLRSCALPWMPNSQKRKAPIALLSSHVSLSSAILRLTVGSSSPGSVWYTSRLPSAVSSVVHCLSPCQRLFAADGDGLRDGLLLEGFVFPSKAVLEGLVFPGELLLEGILFLSYSSELFRTGLGQAPLRAFPVRFIRDIGFCVTSFPKKSSRRCSTLGKLHWKRCHAKYDNLQISYRF